MRVPFVLCLSVAACSADPAPPVGGDIGLNPPFDLGIDAVDTGTPEDRTERTELGQADNGPADAGLDARCTPGMPNPCTCAGESGRRVCNPDGTEGACICSGVADASIDLGTDAPPDVTDDRPRASDAGCDPDVPVPCPCGFSSGTRECRADGTLGLCQCGVATDAGSDVPADVRINCADPIGPDILCTSHADCTRCIPGAFNSIWCCARSGVCAGTSNPTCN